jgi:hypothetical protein
MAKRKVKSIKADTEPQVHISGSISHEPNGTRCHDALAVADCGDIFKAWEIFKTRADAQISQAVLRGNKDIKLHFTMAMTYSTPNSKKRRKAK